MHILSNTNNNIITSTGISQPTFVTLKYGNDANIANLPVLSLSIQQSTDCSLYKTLAGSFSIATFQDKPSLIKITGLVPVKKDSNCSNNLTDLAGLLTLYNTIKASNTAAKQKLTISVNSNIYHCALLTLKYQNADNFPGVIFYQISLVGAR